MPSPESDGTQNRDVPTTSSLSVTPPLKSPFSPLLSPFNPNDDKEERARVRAHKAASQRKSLLPDIENAVSKAPRKTTTDGLSMERIKALYQNCIKLASENKINQKNTWDLRLIDHISDIVKADTEEDTNTTNFQKASCTLEAGVKIYSYRVDSVHTEAFKVLGGLNRTAVEEEQPAAAEDQGHGGADDDGDDDEEGGPSALEKKGKAKKAGALSSHLEANLEALNVKKFDLAFAVDPLFHQTSAQFDEGGARGLLLNNLSVYRGCEIVFDSSEVPEHLFGSAATAAGAVGGGCDGAAADSRDACVDLSFMWDDVEAMLGALTAAKPPEISPSLRKIVALMEDPRRTAAEAEAAAAAAKLAKDRQTREASGAAGDGPAAFGGSGSGAAGEGSVGSPGAGSVWDGTAGEMPGGGDDFGQDQGVFDDDSDANSEGYGAPEPGDGFDAGGEGGGLGGKEKESMWGDWNEQEGLEGAGGASATAAYDGEMGQGEVHDPDEEEEQGGGGPHPQLGAIQGSNAWAGPTHWRYKRPKAEEGAEEEAAGGMGRRKAAAKPRAKRKPKEPAFIDFFNLPEVDAAAFEPPANLKDINLSRAVTSTAAPTLLPRDVHYDPLRLLRLFLRPDWCMWDKGKKKKRASSSSGGGQAGRQSIGAALADAARTPARNSDGPDGGDFFGRGPDDGPGGGYADSCGDDDDDDADGGDAYGSSWDPMGGGASPFDGAAGEWAAAMDGGEELLAQPRKVEKIRVTYARASKQVDVRVLKETLWSQLRSMPPPTPPPRQLFWRVQTFGVPLEGASKCVSYHRAPAGRVTMGLVTSALPLDASMQEEDKEERRPQRNEEKGGADGEGGLSFKQLLASFPATCQAAPLEDISVHLCFICVLHLANEHDLAIKGCSSMDELRIHNLDSSSGE
eukprot:jgi/Mesen1/9329/ME000061S08777